MTSANETNVPTIRNVLEALAVRARDEWKGRWELNAEDKGRGRFDPVTELDRKIERAMRDLIGSICPDDAIWGEEEGWSNRNGNRTWSLDPVDGTRALICDLPNWAVLVGVLENGLHVAGMIDLPVLDECFLAVDGCAYRNGKPVRSSACEDLGSARLTTTDPFLFEGMERTAFERVRQASLVTRYGLDALGYARVASGGIDLVVENNLARHDLDAVVAVVRGAGGHVGDWSGGEDWDGGRIVAAATAPLYDSAVALLSA